MVALNKVDALTDEEIAEKKAALEEAVGGKVMLLSGVAQTGVEEVLRELYRIIEDDRRAENEEDGERTEFTP